jgi:CDP-diacylglycerol--glycerol-3-phosphate 3-phosphatidyltransferase
MKINLASKITLSRILLSIVLIILMLINIVKPINMWILGIIFAIAALTDKLDGYIARSRNQVTDFGKVTDAIADKILVTPILFIMAISGMLFDSVVISLIIPLLVFFRDEIVNNVKTIASTKGPVVAASSLGKAKTACMMTGMAILMFGFPEYLASFGVILNVIGQILVVIGTVLSVISGIQYWVSNKKYIFE